MKIYVKETRSRGKGIFAKQNIKKGEIITVVKGKIYTIKNSKDAKRQGLDENYLHQIDWDKFINNTTISRFTNHSCNPNSGIKNKIELVAMRNIKKDEEITVDYDTFDYGTLGTFKCKCGSKNCRKIIRGYKYLPEKLKKKYKGYISEYLLKSPSATLVR